LGVEKCSNARAGDGVGQGFPGGGWQRVVAGVNAPGLGRGSGASVKKQAGWRVHAGIAVTGDRMALAFDCFLIFFPLSSMCFVITRASVAVASR
jgi:hypothetical protein